MDILKKFIGVIDRHFYRAIDLVLVTCLSVMFVMVFGNVLLRIFLNTGINLSEEIPRFAFVWMTFLGAVVGLRKNAHVGVDMVVRLLPTVGRKTCWAICQLVILVSSGYMVYGTYLQHDIIVGNSSPVAQLSMVWVYGISYVSGSALAVIAVSNLLRLVLGDVAENELITVHEEGLADLDLPVQPLSSATTSHPR